MSEDKSQQGTLQPADFMGMEKLRPTIQRKSNPAEDSIFKNALANMHKIDPSLIEESVEGMYKFYKINGHVIFRDIANV